MNYIPNLDITNHGFRIDILNRRLKDTSLLSLQIALKSYFSSYHSMKNNLKAFENTGLYPLSEDEINFNYRKAYFDNYTETIVHFHHCFELMFKNILQQKYGINEDNVSKMQFSKALDEICNKIDINDSLDLQFIVNARNWLRDLNYLRNRLLHRGLYMLKYNAFDEFIGKYIFPFIRELEIYFKDDMIPRLWMYEELECSLDPIEEIIRTFNTGSYNIKKIALLKELGRASYNNVLPDKIWENLNRTEHIKAIEDTAENYRINVSEIKKCPVCSLNTLVSYFDTDGEYDDVANDGSYTRMWEVIFKVKCAHCNFELFDEIGNPSDYGLNQLEDYFWSKYL